MEFTAISAHKSKTVCIKSLQGAVSHFEKVAFELHSADALLKPRHEMELEDAELGLLQDDEEAEGHTTFTLFVPAATHQAIARGELTWLVRQHLGTNMTKRLRVGASIDIKSNKSRLEATVANVDIGSCLAEVVSALLARGARPKNVALAATHKEDIMAKLKGTQMLSDAGNIVAFELKLIGGHSEDTPVEGVAAEPADVDGQTLRRLMARPSDAVDLSSSGVRDKYRSVVQVVKRYNGDITQLDGFGRLATEALRNQFGNSLLPALTYVSNVVMCTIPRELDYIAKNDGQPVKGITMDLNSLRGQLADRLLTMCVHPDAMALARAAGANGNTPGCGARCQGRIFISL